MKKILFIIITLISTLSFSQTEKDSLRMDIINSIKAVNSSDKELLLKYFPDFVFEKITKEELLKDISDGIKYHISEDIKVGIDTIITINSTKYARFYFEDGVRTYGIKSKNNTNWTFTDLNEMTSEYIPHQIQATEKNN